MSAVRQKAVDAMNARMQLTADVGGMVTADELVEAIENAGLLVVDPGGGAENLLDAIFEPLTGEGSADAS